MIKILTLRVACIKAKLFNLYLMRASSKYNLQGEIVLVVPTASLSNQVKLWIRTGRLKNLTRSAVAAASAADWAVGAMDMPPISPTAVSEKLTVSLTEVVVVVVSGAITSD